MNKQTIKKSLNILNKNKGFTLVELIIVITILAILAIIAFISFQGYSGNARDGNRLTTLSNIQKGLDIYQVKVGNYPHPDDVTGTGTFGGLELNYVGKIKDTISRVININKTPVDPQTQDNYVYGVSANHQKYQLATTLESLEANSLLVPTTYAASSKAKVVGNYTYPLRLGTKIYSLPSLIFVGTGDLINNSTGFIVNNSSNVPYSLGGTVTNTVNVTEQLQQITGTGNLTLTGVDISQYTSIESVTGVAAEQIAASLGVSVKDLGNILFNNNDTASSNSGGEVQAPQPEATAENYFEFYSESQTITGYDFEGPKDVVIPSKIGGVNVLKIGVDAFSGLNLTSVIIPNTVTTIEGSAFYNNKLVSITIPNSVTNIGALAFNKNKLPDNQAMIYKRNSNGSIDTSTLASYGGANTNPVIPSNVKTLGEYSFAHSQLTSITIPSTVETIGNHSFYNNSLTSIIFERDANTTIGTSVFGATGLSGINQNVYGTWTIVSNTWTKTVPPQATAETYFDFNSGTQTITGYNSSGPKDVVIPSKIGGVDVLIIGDEAFYGRNLTSVIIPNGVIRLAYSAFDGNQLTSIYLPNSLTNIGGDAFSNNQLTSVTIPNSVTHIGGAAFSNNQLTTITIPNSVTNIGNYAFLNNQLTSVTIPNSVTNIGEGAFNSNKLPDNQAMIYKRNSDGSIDNTIVVSYGGSNKTPTIPNSITTLGDNAFANNQLTSVTIPSSITTLGDNVFFNNQLTSITIPISVTTLGDGAFASNQLTSVTIPSSITTLGNSVFSSNQLTSVTIPNSITSIGTAAFNINKLVNITIPANVVTIGGSAFLNNPTLTSVTFQRNANTTIGSQAFGVDTKLSGTIQNAYGTWNKAGNTWDKQ